MTNPPARSRLRAPGAIPRRLCLTAALAAIAGRALAPARLAAAPPQAAPGGRTGRGLRLLVVERPGCSWCRRFEAEIAPLYPRHPQGARAPLMRVGIDGPWPDGLVLARRPYLTPSFILLDGGVELGRIEGYPGEAGFWHALAALMPEDRG